MSPRKIVDQIESDRTLPPGTGDRFAGYSVIGLPFLSGHVLALRRFPVSSIGPAYTSVWHRDSRGTWTFYSTLNPELGCSRYFGGEVTRNVVAPIRIEWTGATQFTVSVGNVVRWGVRLGESSSTRLMNSLARLVPDRWWRRTSVLNAMGLAGRFVLGTGRMNLAGLTPNGQEFLANLRLLWLIDSSRAIVDGVDLGPVGPLPRQACLNDFLIPQRGLFAVVRAFLESRPPVSNVVARRSDWV